MIWLPIKAVAIQAKSFNQAPFLFAYSLTIRDFSQDESSLTVCATAGLCLKGASLLPECPGRLSLKHMAFPAGFGWGAATSAYQVEGRRNSLPSLGLGWMPSHRFCMSAEECGDKEAKKKKKKKKKKKGKHCACVLSCFSHVRFCATPWTLARQAPLSMGTLQARILEWVAMPSSR